MFDFERASKIWGSCVSLLANDVTKTVENIVHILEIKVVWSWINTILHSLRIHNTRNIKYSIKSTNTFLI
jgi:hypothetical protein